VVPQHNRRPRPIVDYTYSQLNHATKRIAPSEAMQFGRALDRLLHKIHHVNRAYGPVYLIKVDLADGFYRVPLAASDLPSLAVAFPNAPSEPPLVALPLALPMGWVLSPPYFCAFTESVADLANQSLRLQPSAPPTHPLSIIADNPNNEPEPTSLPPQTTWHRDPFSAITPQQPLAYVDIYMDDFVAIAQGSPSTLSAVRSTVFHAIDEVFRPLQPSDQSSTRKHPISLKKLHLGDGKWQTRRTILGWVIDTDRETIELPPHRAARLASSNGKNT
jgi:hypothetical protein